MDNKPIRSATKRPTSGKPRSIPESQNPLGALGQALLIASSVIGQVRDGAALSDVLSREWSRQGDLSGHVRGKAQDLIYGTLRDFGRGEVILKNLAERGINHGQIVGLLYTAIHILETGSETAHATVDQSVMVAKQLAEGRFSGLVNGILRNYLRMKVDFDRKLHVEEVTNLRLPRWWIVKLRKTYPSQWMEIIEATNSHPPMCLRVNRRKVRRSVYLNRLTEAEIAGEKIGRDGILLKDPVPVQRLPGFAEGHVSVQDASAQLAQHWLDAKAGMHVLDACAAPGGKTCHMLEYADCDLLALDSETSRSQKIQENLTRLHLQAQLKVADARNVSDWWDGKPFDRILADVPCSASGVVRRQPDIKWHRQQDDLNTFTQIQSEILDALWQTLKPGGRLLYATCSVFPEENSIQITRFVSRTPDAHRVLIDGKVERQILPNAQQDGFYYALLEKNA